MRRQLLRAALAAGLALTVAGSAAGADGNVTIKGFAFAPPRITVTAGDSVRWTNEDGAGHTATGEDGSFGTGMINPTGSATVTSTTAGTFRYYCSPHRSMLGTGVVVPAAPATDTELPAPATAPSGLPAALLLALVASILTLIALRAKATRRG